MNEQKVNNFLYYTQYKRKIKFVYFIFEKKVVLFFLAWMLINYALNFGWHFSTIFLITVLYSFFSYSKGAEVKKYYEIRKHWIVQFIERLKNESME